MYKISLLTLVIHSSAFAMLGPVLQLAKRLPGVVRPGVIQQQSILVQQRWMLYDRYQSDSIKNILQNEVGYDFNYQSVNKELTQEKRAKILKKLMIRINRGENYDFYFRMGGVDNGAVYCHSGNDGSREMQFHELIMKKDWTNGKFIDLARYFKAVNFIRSEEADDSAKRISRAIIQNIMKEYGIKEEDVIVAPKAEASRVQEAE